VIHLAAGLFTARQSRNQILSRGLRGWAAPELHALFRGA